VSWSCLGLSFPLGLKAFKRYEYQLQVTLRLSPFEVIRLNATQEGDTEVSFPLRGGTHDGDRDHAFPFPHFEILTAQPAKMAPGLTFMTHDYLVGFFFVAHVDFAFLSVFFFLPHLSS
jgi:hypothetical protein